MKKILKNVKLKAAMIFAILTISAAVLSSSTSLSGRCPDGLCWDPLTETCVWCDGCALCWPSGYDECYHHVSTNPADGNGRCLYVKLCAMSGYKCSGNLMLVWACWDLVTCFSD